jgi:hypothetical protein
MQGSIVIRAGQVFAHLVGLLLFYIDQAARDSKAHVINPFFSGFIDLSQRAMPFVVAVYVVAGLPRPI